MDWNSIMREQNMLVKALIMMLLMLGWIVGETNFDEHTGSSVLLHLIWLMRS